MVSQRAKGFTFIEVLAVVGITAILGAVTVPNYLNHRQQVAVDAEADKLLAFVRDGISKARSQEGGEVWAIEFVDSGDQDYYQLRKGGAEGTPVNVTYLGSGVEFADGTTGSSTVLFGGPNVQILPTADSVIEARLHTKNGNFWALVSMDALGRVARSTLAEPCEPVVNGGWSATWVNSGSCGQYQACKQKQIKYCNTPTPACGGLACVEEEGVQYIDCGLVNGGWSDYGACVSCTRTRTCTNPAPACGGANCIGSATDTAGCVINGGWTSWSTCVANWQTRTCTNPTPACGGTSCTGASGQACTTCDPVRDCGGYWSACSSSCANVEGTKTWTTTTEPCDGEPCPASPASCYGAGAPVNCQGSWNYASCSNITACSTACTGAACGTRTYTITTPASCGGTACPYSNGATETCYGTQPAVNCSGYVDYSYCSQISVCATTCPETVCGYRRYHITTPASCGGTACQYTDNYVLETCYGTKANDAYVGSWTITGGCGTDGCNICRKPQKRYCVAGSCASFTCSGSPPGTVMDTSCNVNTDCNDAAWSTAYYMLGGCGTGGCAANRVPVAKQCQGNCGDCDGTPIGSYSSQLGCQLASNFGIPTVDGDWSAWSTCSGATSCYLSGTQTRTCTNPAPSCGGAACVGSTSQSCGGISGRTYKTWCGTTAGDPVTHYIDIGTVCTAAPIVPTGTNCLAAQATPGGTTGKKGTVSCTHTHNFGWSSDCTTCNYFLYYTNASIAGGTSCSCPCID